MVSKSSTTCFGVGDQGAEKLTARCKGKVVTLLGANPRLSTKQPEQSALLLPPWFTVFRKKENSETARVI